MSLHVEQHHASRQRGAEQAAGSIELRAISQSEWRVSDRRIPAGDAGSVLGFIEQVDEQTYEVLRLGHGCGVDRLTFGSLDEIAVYFARL